MKKKFNINCETLIKILAVKLNLQQRNDFVKWLKNKVVHKTSRYKCFFF